MPLTDKKIRNTRPSIKTIRLFDGGGLYLEVAPSGGKWWRFKYRFGGKEKRLSLGVYRDVSLKAARERLTEVRKLLANGIDPSHARQAKKEIEGERRINAFELVAREWYAKHSPNWAESHASKIILRLEKDIFPWLGKESVDAITAPMLLKTLRRIEGRGTVETAHRAMQNCGQVFRYAVATGRAERDPTPDLRGALPSVKRKHYASITEPQDVGGLLRAIDGFRGSFVVQCALRLAPLLFVRPGELRKAEWAHFNLEKSEWRFITSKTKTEHLVPLSKQAVGILKELHPLSGHGRYVFPGRDPMKPMSEAAVNAALRRLGFDTKTEITGHGFRAMARTILAKQLHFKPEIIEHQLAHRVPDILGTAYNRTKFLKQRIEMMQAWADYLDSLAVGASVIPINRAA